LRDSCPQPLVSSTPPISKNKNFTGESFKAFIL
jgi:hypothetical protein